MAEAAGVSLGLAEIDAHLAGGGLARGRVHQIVGGHYPPEDPTKGVGDKGEAGSGRGRSSTTALRVPEVTDAAPIGFAAALICRLLADAPRARRRVLWCPRRDTAAGGAPYGLGMAQLGLGADSVIWVDAPDDQARLDIAEEALRCPGLGCVVVEMANAGAPGVKGTIKGVGRGGPDALSVATRRLQLAAETGGVTGLVLTPETLEETVRHGPHNTARATQGNRRGSAGLGAYLETRWRVASLPVSPLSAEGPGGLGSILDWRPRWRVVLERARGGRPGTWPVLWSPPETAGSLADQGRFTLLNQVISDGQPSESTPSINPQGTHTSHPSASKVAEKDRRVA